MIFLDEARDVLRAGLSSRLDHGGRHRRAPPSCERLLHQIGMRILPGLEQRQRRTAANFLELLRAGHGD